jgi:hypothetical protein
MTFFFVELYIKNKGYVHAALELIEVYFKIHTVFILKIYNSRKWILMFVVVLFDFLQHF